jgi:hypothetical protein
VVQWEPRLVAEPHPVVGPDGRIYLYVEINQGALERRVIFRAASDDGVTWKMTPRRRCWNPTAPTAILSARHRCCL